MIEDNIIVTVKSQKYNFFSRLSKEMTKNVIENLNNEKVLDFLMQNKVDKNVLKKEFNKDDYMTYPLLFIDLENKKLASSYSEMDYAFEKYCPKDYIGIYGNILNLISKDLRFWE